jgi:hypothetical protein
MTFVPVAAGWDPFWRPDPTFWDPPNKVHAEYMVKAAVV